MIFIKTENKRVTSINYVPFDKKYGTGKTVEEMNLEGFLVDNISEPEVSINKSPIMMYNSDTNSVYYEYEDIPKTPEEIQKEELAQLRQEDLNNKEAIAELYMMTMGGI